MKELVEIRFKDIAPEWAQSHLQVPTPIVLNNGNLRVFYATRNNEGRSLTTYFDIIDDFKIQKYDEPVLQLGDVGTFDRDGIMVSSIVRNDDFLHMYYTGWSRSSEVPYKTSIGLAISLDEGKTFVRHSSGPVIGEDVNNPLFTNTPFVTKYDGIFHCFFGSGLNWHSRRNIWEPQYQIKHATSINGIEWITNPNPILRTIIDDESNVRPWLIEVKDGFNLYYCFRGIEDFRDGNDSYKIASVFSKDLKNWSEPTIFEELNSFKSKKLTMCAYPSIVNWKEKNLLFYNGNTFGKLSMFVIEI